MSSVVEPEPAGGGGSEHVDEAALAGTALAAVLALFLGEGAWDWVVLPVGIALLGVLGAFYELPNESRGLSWRFGRGLIDEDWPRRAEVITVAIIVSLCLLLVFAWPTQSVMHWIGGLQECDHIQEAQMVSLRGDQAWQRLQLKDEQDRLAGIKNPGQDVKDSLEIVEKSLGIQTGEEEALVKDAGENARGACWGEKTSAPLGVLTAALFVITFGVLAKRSSSAKPSQTRSKRDGRR
jgi:hypothetical protein